MWWVLGIILAAALVRGTFGFGDALVGMPLLLLRMEWQVAAPLIAMISVTIAAGILLQDWHRVHFRDAWMLIVSAVFGIIFGLLVLVRLDEAVITGVLGGVIVLFSAYALLHPRLLELKTERTAPLFGLLAGALSGAYNAPGPPLVIYGAMRRWSAQHFRATMQAFFLPTGIVVVIGHAFEQRITTVVLTYFAAGAPIAVGCLLVGRQLNAKFRTERFIPWVYALLILLGAALIVKAVWPAA